MIAQIRREFAHLRHRCRDCDELDVAAFEAEATSTTFSTPRATVALSRRNRLARDQSLVGAVGEADATDGEAGQARSNEPTTHAKQQLDRTSRGASPASPTQGWPR